MTYDEWQQSQSAPPPPFSIGGIEYGRNSTPLPPPSTAGGLLPDVPGMGDTVYNAFRGMQNFLAPRPTTNPSFAPMPGGTNPSFSPMPGERPALQMPGLASGMSQIPAALMPGYSTLRRIPPPNIRRDLSRLRDWWNRTGYQEPPDFRSMPRYNAGPEATPYPRPPWMNLRNWMDTGERGPLPLQRYSPGGYPAPANPQMPEVYDTRTSGGALA